MRQKVTLSPLSILSFLFFLFFSFLFFFFPLPTGPLSFSPNLLKTEGFLSALEADPQFSFAYVEYGRFLAARDQPLHYLLSLFQCRYGLFLFSLVRPLSLSNFKNQTEV